MEDERIYKPGELPTAQDITNWYLYGQKRKPDNLLDPSTWRPYGKDKITLTVDHETYDICISSN